MLDTHNSYSVGCSTQNEVILQEMFINLNYILECFTSILDVKNYHKGYIKLIRVLFSANYSTIRTILYCTLKIEEILNLSIFVCLVFSNYVILVEPLLSISKTIFPTLIFHLRLKYQLPDVRLQKFYMHSTYVINHLI